MSKEFFITTDLQWVWMDKLSKLKHQIRSSAEQTDRLAKFPKENVQSLVELGYTTLALPKEYGGGGMTVTDMRI